MPTSLPTSARITARWLQHPSTQAVFAALAAGGYHARAVGGAVRNSLLGHEVADIDIATSAEPRDVVRCAHSAGLRVVETGLKHGTVTVITDGHPIEVTTLREDVATDGRHAEVAFTDDWIADASRRDFTINALYCDADGHVFDPLGGLEDLAVRRVRFIGDATARIREDYLRILRFFRFFAQYSNGQPDPEGITACVRERRGLKRLSGERLRQELLKLILARRAQAAVTTMLEHGLLTEILPVAPRPRLFQRMLRLDTEGDWALRLAALAVRVPEDAARLAIALKLSNAERRTLRDAAGGSCRHVAIEDEAALRHMLYRSGAEAYRHCVLIAWAGSDAPVDDRAFSAALDLPNRWAVPTFPLSGPDVMALGVPSGPLIGAHLRALEESWIERDFEDQRADLLSALRDRVLNSD